MYHLQPTILHKREGSEEKKPKHLYSLKKGAGMLNKEEIELLFHSLNSEMFVKYKGKTFWRTWETLEQGRGSFVVKGASI